jgi:uncharacterized membrane protein YgcG
VEAGRWARSAAEIHKTARTLGGCPYHSNMRTSRHMTRTGPRRHAVITALTVVLAIAAWTALTASSALAAPLGSSLPTASRSARVQDHGQARVRTNARSRATGSALSAASTGEQIRSYTVDLRLTKDDVLHVRETISYDFATHHKHGIERTIPVEYRYRKGYLREFPLSHIKVSSPTGAPAQEQTLSGATTTIRIGDPDNENVTGVQTYVISYDVAGTVNSFSDHQELYWNAVGNQWSVPVDAVTATVAGPAAVQKVACYIGRQGSRATCPGTIRADGTAGFSVGAQPSQAGMTIVASFPVGTFPDAGPILKQRWTWGRAFSVNRRTLGASLALFVLLSGAAIVLAVRRGRDERYLGITPGLQPSFGEDLPVGRVGWRRDPVAVQFAPPPGVRPGELGALIDERVETLHVTATIIDLAVRGYLTIEQTGRPRKAGKDRESFAGDWKLTRPKDKTPTGLRGYEATLYGLLFGGGRVTSLSRLRRNFLGKLIQVKADLEQDIEDRGWFRTRPSKVRARWRTYAWVTIVAGLALTWALAARTSYGLLGPAVVLAGVVLLVLSARMPARSAQGTALLAQTRGFRLYLEKAEAHQLRFEEGEDIFSRYLPYAIIFGVAERWAALFAELAASGAYQVTPGWYSGSTLDGSLAYIWAGDTLTNFTAATETSLTAVRVPTSPAAGTSGSSGDSGFGGGMGGGGYSGGGDGGGGGGSW